MAELTELVNISEQLVQIQVQAKELKDSDHIDLEGGRLWYEHQFNVLAAKLSGLPIVS